MAKPDPKTPDPLIKTIDEAFRVLLERALADVTVQAEGEPKPVSFTPAEQIKALEAAVVWAEKRAKILPTPTTPAEPKGSKFDGIRDRVRIGGQAPGRRGNGAVDQGDEAEAD